MGASYAQDWATPDHIKVYNIGASYDFGVAQLMGYYLVGEAGDAKRANYSVGANVPLGWASCVLPTSTRMPAAR